MTRQDLRVAVLNVERARAQYHIQRADRVEECRFAAIRISR
jgi:outer membrane protein TolC